MFQIYPRATLEASWCVVRVESYGQLHNPVWLRTEREAKEYARSLGEEVITVVGRAEVRATSYG